MLLDGPSLHDATLTSVSYKNGELLLSFDQFGRTLQLQFSRERKAELWAHGFLFPMIVHTPEVVAIDALDEPLASLWRDTALYNDKGSEWFLSLDPLFGGPDVGVAFCGDPATLQVESGA